MDVPALAERFRAAVDDTGVLLIHDQVLPSATALAAGEPVKGSWWAHELAHPIYDALQLIEDDVTRAKLVRGKVTLIAPRLWPALASVGASRQPWQLTGLAPDATELLEAVDATSAPMRTPTGRSKELGVLERRLLVRTDEVHTESGRHAKVLQPWSMWVTSEPQARGDVDPIDAIASFERAVSGWPTGAGRLFPWGD